MSYNKNMFNPKTERIKKLTKLFPKLISELEGIFGESANIYIDWQLVLYDYVGYAKSSI